MLVVNYYEASKPIEEMSDSEYCMMFENYRASKKAKAKAEAEAKAKAEADKDTQIRQLIDRLDRLTSLVEQLLEQ